MNKDPQKQDPNHYEQLPYANPLQKRSLRKVLSVFPLVQLPQFQYSKLKVDLLPVVKEVLLSPQKQSNARPGSISPRRRTNINASKVLHLEQTELRAIFEKPVYVFNRKLSKGANRNFCNIKAFPEQSRSHEPIEDNPQLFFSDCSHAQNLSFESRFQSGNLAIAAKSNTCQNQYYLNLTKDFNTARCTQWFFFRVLNRNKAKCTFHILNFSKNYSSFEQGMQLCVASNHNGFVFTRAGEDIKYRKTNIKVEQRHMFALTFAYEFEQDQGVTYFSYCFPYTYSQLDRLLFKAEGQNQNIMKRRSLGNSLGGNIIDMIIITNFNIPSNQKKVILITSRVHPGQTPGSFVMQGIINKLLQYFIQQFQEIAIKYVTLDKSSFSNQYQCQTLMGCSLSGYDMNRIWDKCQRDRFPEIYVLKRAIQSSKKPFVFIDLHAHSKKKGCFMYGCSVKNSPFICRQIPFLMWKNVQEFNYYQCTFSTNSQKRQGTGRVNLFRQFGVTLSYTMQHSFCGPLKTRKHFTVTDLQQIGANLILTLEKYYGKGTRPINDQSQMDEALQQFYQNKDLLKVGEAEQKDSSSDSELDQYFQVQLQEEKRQDRSLCKNRPKSKINSQSNVQNVAIKTPRQRFVNNLILTRTTSFRQKPVHQTKIFARRNPWQDIPKIGLNLDEYLRNTGQIMNASSPDRYVQPCNSNRKAHEDNLTSRRFLKPVIRYSQDEVNNLTNLFLPSVTSSSYKKYNKPRNKSKGTVYIGCKFLQNKGIMKQQIKSVTKRRIQWKSAAKTYL